MEQISRFLRLFVAISFSLYYYSPVCSQAAREPLCLRFPISLLPTVWICFGFRVSDFRPAGVCSLRSSIVGPPGFKRPAAREEGNRLLAQNDPSRRIEK